MGPGKFYLLQGLPLHLDYGVINPYEIYWTVLLDLLGADLLSTYRLHQLDMSTPLGSSTPVNSSNKRKKPESVSPYEEPNTVRLRCMFESSMFEDTCDFSGFPSSGSSSKDSDSKFHSAENLLTGSQSDTTLDESNISCVDITYRELITLFLKKPLISVNPY